MIQLYYMNVKGDCSKEQSLLLYNRLPKERQERIDKLKNQQLREERILIGAFQQKVLSNVTGISIEEIAYQYNEQGKPELDLSRVTTKVEGPFYFNMSHSGEYVVLAVSDHPIGIDVEYKTRNYEKVGKRCFHEKEWEQIINAPEELREQLFLKYWTMKEAYVKLLGEGMRISFSSFYINRGESIMSYVKDADIHLATWKLEPQYMVSIAGIEESECSELMAKGRVFTGFSQEITVFSL